MLCKLSDTLCNTNFLLLLQFLVLPVAVKVVKAVPLVPSPIVLAQHLYADLAPVAVDMNALLHLKFGKKMSFNGVTLQRHTTV